MFRPHMWPSSRRCVTKDEYVRYYNVCQPMHTCQHPQWHVTRDIPISSDSQRVEVTRIAPCTRGILSTVYTSSPPSIIDSTLLLTSSQISRCMYTPAATVFSGGLTQRELIFSNVTWSSASWTHVPPGRSETWSESWCACSASPGSAPTCLLLPEDVTCFNSCAPDQWYIIQLCTHAAHYSIQESV